MTAAGEAVERLMRSEPVDVLRESVALVVRELMEVEVWRSQISRSDYGTWEYSDGQ